MRQIPLNYSTLSKSQLRLLHCAGFSFSDLYSLVPAYNDKVRSMEHELLPLTRTIHILR